KREEDGSLMLRTPTPIHILRPIDHNIRQPRSSSLAVDDLHLDVSQARYAARAFLREGDREAGVMDARVPGELHLHVEAAGGRGVIAEQSVVQQYIDIGDAVRRQCPAADGERPVDRFL